MTVKQLLKKFSGILIKENLLQIVVYYDDYDVSNMVENVKEVINDEVIDWDLWTKEEFKDFFCSTIERMFIENKYVSSVRFLTIKIKGGDNE